ncbi:MAG: acetate--CoA ligase family protein [bacterium]|nr:acetate--CoA ligase family protein [bacterium]
MTNRADQAESKLRRALHPRHVAIVGASRRGGIGNDVLANLRRANPDLRVSVIHPTAASIDGTECHASLAELAVSRSDAPVDLAIVSTPAAACAAVVRQLGEAGVAGAIILSAGFTETGEAGRGLAADLSDAARASGIRLIGPNCIGVADLGATQRLQATFAELDHLAGSAALISQSGALGLALLQRAREAGVRVGRLASVGNCLDVDAAELISLWAEDTELDVILLHLEGLGDPERFAAAARRACRHLPLVALKTGRSARGANAAAGHTAALATPDATASAWLARAGVERVDGIDELVAVGAALSRMGPAFVERVAVLSNAGGPAVIAVDALVAAGLEVARTGPDAAARLAERLPDLAALTGPVDMLAAAQGAEMLPPLDILLDDEASDAVLFVIGPPLGITPLEQATTIAAHVASRRLPVPLVVVQLGPRPSTEAVNALAAVGVPLLDDAARAAQALAALGRRARWLERHAKGDPPPHVGRRDAETASSPDGPATFLPEPEVTRRLEAAGVERWPQAVLDVATTGTSFLEGVAGLEPPYVLKASGPGLLHKTDSGAVLLGIPDLPTLQDTAGSLVQRLSDAGTPARSLVVSPQAPSGVELLVGARRSSAEGCVLVVGEGGTWTELRQDVSIVPLPATRAAMRSAVESLRIRPRLHGARGGPPVDVDGLLDLLERVAELLLSAPEIVEIDLNPVRLPPSDGVHVLDARVAVR